MVVTRRGLVTLHCFERTIWIIVIGVFACASTNNTDLNSSIFLRCVSPVSRIPCGRYATRTEQVHIYNSPAVHDEFVTTFFPHVLSQTVMQAGYLMHSFQGMSCNMYGPSKFKDAIMVAASSCHLLVGKN